MNGRSLRDLLGNDKVLGTLAREATRLHELDMLWQRLLPAQLRGLSQVAALRDGRLLVFAQQAAVATRVRFLEASLRQKLEAAGWPVSVIRIRVGRTFDRAPRENRLTIGEQGLAALEAGAGTLEDPALKQALYRLVRHQRERQR